MKHFNLAAGLFAAAAVLTVCNRAYAASNEPTQQNPSALSPYVRMNNNVTPQMLTVDGWAVSDALLADAEQIAKINEANSRTIVLDDRDFTLKEVGEEMTAQEVRDVLQMFAEKRTDAKGYINGKLLPKKYWQEKIENSNMDGVPETLNVRYGYSLRWCNTQMFPCDDFVGEDETDLIFDRMVTSECHPFEPLTILHDSADGEWYFVFLDGFGGWVRKEDVGLCASREDWLARQELTEFLVVTGHELRLLHDESCPGLSDKLLPMGTRMKLVRTADAPEVISDRRTYGSYVVSLPDRDEKGMLVDRYCLIPVSSDVSIGYLPLTTRNLVETALKYTGNRYGLGGQGYANDCSGTAKEIYSCFGVRLPRGVMQQGNLQSATVHDMSQMKTEERLELMKTLPAGSILCFPGHIMLYLGMQNDEPFVISSVGSFVPEDAKQGAVQSVNSVLINSLYVTRKNGSTWLDNLTSAVVAAIPE